MLPSGMARGQGPHLSYGYVPYLVQSWNVQGPCHSAQTVVYFRVTKEVNLKQTYKPYITNLKLAMTVMLKILN